MIDLYLVKLVRSDAIIKIIINDGNITPRVDIKAPRIDISAFVAPIKVAMLIAKGPGVDSL